VTFTYPTALESTRSQVPQQGTHSLYQVPELASQGGLIWHSNYFFYSFSSASGHHDHDSEILDRRPWSDAARDAVERRRPREPDPNQQAAFKGGFHGSPGTTNPMGEKRETMSRQPFESPRSFSTLGIFFLVLIVAILSGLGFFLRGGIGFAAMGIVPVLLLLTGRFQRIPVAHLGTIVFMGGRWHRPILAEGYHWRPIGFEFVVTDAHIQSLNLASVKVVSKDSVAATLDASVTWQVTVPSLFLGVQTQLQTTNLPNAARAAVIRGASQYTIEQLLATQGESDPRLAAEARQATAPWGITVHSFEITHIHVSPEVQRELELLTQVRARVRADAVNQDAVLRFIEQLVNAGMDREAATELVQIERGKITKDVRRIDVDWDAVARALRGLK
ncbi:SPFH domain-containing protein, partial [bacterium]|nr:SPFH domain-containing protein [bacterium]